MNNDPTANALHAAETWLARIDAAPDAVAVVNFFPQAAVGTLLPAHPWVDMLPTIDDQGAELCDAAAPWLQVARERQIAGKRR